VRNRDARVALLKLTGKGYVRNAARLCARNKVKERSGEPTLPHNRNLCAAAWRVADCDWVRCKFSMVAIMTRPTDADMLKLEQAFFRNLQRDDCEYGAIGVDCKRPFGNSDVEGDILELIGAKPDGDDGESEYWSRCQREYAADMYSDLIEWLQKKYLRKSR